MALSVSSAIDELWSLQQILWDAQWRTALTSAACHEAAEVRKVELVDQALPWTPSVERLLECSTEVAELWGLASDAQSRLRGLRRMMREGEDRSDRLAGAHSDEVKAELRLQDTRRNLSDVIEELHNIATVLTNQLQDLDKVVNTSVTC